MTPNEILGIASGYSASKILMTANKVGLLGALEEAPADVRSLASSLNLHEESTKLLCNALVAFHVLSKDGQLYRLSDGGGPTMSGKRFQYRHWIEFQESLWKYWENLEEIVRRGPHLEKHYFSHDLFKDRQALKLFVTAMHEKAVHGAQVITEVLPLECRHMVLDLGGGTGTYALEFCQRFPLMRGMVYDFPEVAELSRGFIDSYGLQDRVTVSSGNFLEDPLAGQPDLVVIANVLHMYPAKTCEQLLQRVYETLLPGGQVIIHGYIRNENEISPPEAAVFALLVPYLTPIGVPHTSGEIEQWLLKCGFADISTISIEARPSTVITGVKADPENWTREPWR